MRRRTHLFAYTISGDYLTSPWPLGNAAGTDERTPKHLYFRVMGNNQRGNGIFFSKPWSRRPSWSKAKDVVSIGLTGIVLLIVIWEAGRRWLGY